MSDKTGYPSDLMEPFAIPSSDFASEELMTYVKPLPFPCVSYIWEKEFAYRQPISLDGSLATIWMGYWQSESFFEEVKPLIRNAFQFNQKRLNSQTKKLSEKILSECAIGVHIRRRDYIEPHNLACYGHVLHN